MNRDIIKPQNRLPMSIPVLRRSLTVCPTEPFANMFKLCYDLKHKTNRDLVEETNRVLEDKSLPESSDLVQACKAGCIFTATDKEAVVAEWIRSGKPISPRISQGYP